jgi:hypothetical protein
VAGDVRDFELRRHALEHVRELSRRYDDVIPVAVLREGFATPQGRIGFGTFYSGIYRPRQFVGPAALSLVTAPPKERRDAPYDDEYDEATGTFTYHFAGRHCAARHDQELEENHPPRVQRDQLEQLRHVAG